MCVIHEDKEIRILERKILRRIMGPIKTQKEEYKSLINYEIKNLKNEEHIVKCAKAQRRRCSVTFKEENKMLQ